MRILLYNIMLCSPVYMVNGQMQRTAEIVKKIKAEVEMYDVVVFLEVFYSAGKKMLIEKLRPLYPYWEELPRSRFSFVSGGVVVMSRYPIVQKYHQFYRNASSVERLASKGFLWTRIRHPIEGMVNVVSTHCQSWAIHAETRHRQFGELRKWLAQGLLAHSEPLLVVGDFNWCFHAHRPEFYKSVGKNIQLPQLLGDLKYTADSSRNNMRGLDGSAGEKGCDKSYYCKICFSSSGNPGLCSVVCKKPRVKENMFCSCCSSECNDYGYIPEYWPLPTQFDMCILEWKTKRKLHFDCWKLSWITMPVLSTRDLSDHFPCLIDVKWRPK
jgi:endonuclease/exonuclease/phosphatase family metal-dependent hydrolase